MQRYFTCRSAARLRLRSGLVLSLACVLIAGLSVGEALACDRPNTAIGLSRIVEIDTRTGPLFGKISRFEKQPTFLKPNEVILTFDDGPSPKVTDAILRTLAEHCTLATFFPVGKRALRFPKTLRAVAAAGHTIGAHTWSHPNLSKLSEPKSRQEIERGFAAVALAADTGIAPFFRFPGLADTQPLLDYGKDRGVATFTVDVVSDDSYAKSTQAIVDTVFSRIKEYGAGIMLFHDLRMRTAKALPTVLKMLKEQGFKVVHIRPKTPITPDPAFRSVLQPALAAGLKRQSNVRVSVPLPAAIARAPVETWSPKTPPEAPGPTARSQDGSPNSAQ
ncbi:MAG: polysaccharide deacetylase family protein [Pseudomonadota bacterium]